jgi:hypothetical protein
MLTRLVKGLLNPRLNAATIKLNAKTNLIPHLKNKIFAGSAQSFSTSSRNISDHPHPGVERPQTKVVQLDILPEGSH